jgi:hypothetical protein
MSIQEPQRSPQYFCPIFNFDILETEEESDEPSRIHVVKEKEPIKRFKFLANTTICGIRKKDLQADVITNMMFDEHVAGAFYKKYEDIPVIEFYDTPEDKLVSLVENIVFTLRLFKEGDVFCKIIWAENHLHQIILNPFYELPSTIHSERYLFKIREIDQIHEIFEKVNKTDFDRRRPLKIARDRLNRSYGKSMYEEKIVDFMIAFEALFLRESSTCSGQIIGTGCSTLIGKTDKERKEIYDFMKKTYKLRNDIVHGSAIDYSGIREKALKLKELLRKSMLILL